MVSKGYFYRFCLKDKIDLSEAKHMWGKWLHDIFWQYFFVANAESVGEFFRAKSCLPEIRTCGRLTLARCQVLYHSPPQLNRVEKI